MRAIQRLSGPVLRSACATTVGRRLAPGTVVRAHVGDRQQAVFDV